MHYGTHVVQRAYGGGSMMFTIYAKNFSTPTEAYTAMGELLNTIVGYLDDIYVGNYKSTKTISNQDERLRYTISYLGKFSRSESGLEQFKLNCTIYAVFCLYRLFTGNASRVFNT